MRNKVKILEDKKDDLGSTQNHSLDVSKSRITGSNRFFESMIHR